MDNSPPSPQDASAFDTSAFAPISSDDVVLGYPETAPPSIDLGPVPSGVGAKPTPTQGQSSGNGSGPAPKANNGPARAAPQRSGPPLPKRPKGRLFIGTIFLSVMVGFILTVFNTMLRYTAYGEVVGRRIDLTVPWPGVVRSLHVREGDRVETGQLIAKIDSLEMRQKIEEIDDSLRLERARLASELAMLRWEAEKIRDTRKLSLSDFYDKWSELLWEQSRLADLRMQVTRLEPIYREGAASEERLESLQFQLAGQEKRVEQMTEAVKALKQRTEDAPLELALEDRVQPTLARIENLQSELLRTRELIRQGEVRAPAAGRIVRTHRFAGEFADQNTPVAELFVEGSTELVLYLPQAAGKDYPIGRTVTLNINPINTNVSCQVQRVAMEMQNAPPSLARYYEKDQSLLPVYLRVQDSRQITDRLVLGSEVRLPRSADVSMLARLRGWWYGKPTSEVSGNNHSVQPLQPLPPVRTVMQQRDQVQLAEKKIQGRTGQTAGWIQQP